MCIRDRRRVHGELFGELELYIAGHLRQFDKVTVQEVVEVATTYNLTRVGSRDMYRLIEVVIRQKFADIQKDGQVANTLYTLYTKSALCTPELVEKLGKVAF
eukprot:TRINITY_DN2128_c0_g1_i15.p3 TRINITY_DN2128_c0_g1~~TRINITY_DN2128_c0_g1_i15.p3  ORF type:complete len:102 (+),score=19.11 TRINITY_DN2128_c0_g1_i15:65-370(+)